MIDDGIQQAVQIGERNKVIIGLARNWCAHIEVQHSGGVGMVEMSTGLPIGMRSFKCAYARAAGMAGMNLEAIALDFYDRNCADCKQRLPVRLPNLSQLVADRETARRQDSAAKARASEAQAKELADRAARRFELAQSCDPPRVGILSTIGEFDKEPTDSNGRILVATATTGSQHFDAQLQEALFDLAEAGGGARTDPSLEALTILDADSGRLCACALRSPWPLRLVCSCSRHCREELKGRASAFGFRGATGTDCSSVADAHTIRNFTLRRRCEATTRGIAIVSGSGARSIATIPSFV